MTLPDEIVENRETLPSQSYSCTAYGGYPKTGLIWEVRLVNDTEFHPFDPSTIITNQYIPGDCLSNSTIETRLELNMDYHLAEIKCVIPQLDYYGNVTGSINVSQAETIQVVSCR